MGFPLHKPYPYCLYRWGFLHFRYLKCLVIYDLTWFLMPKKNTKKIWQFVSEETFAMVTLARKVWLISEQSKLWWDAGGYMSHHITELSVRLILYISVVSTAKDVRKCHVAPKMHPNRKNKKFKQTKHKKDKTYARKNKSILPSQKKKNYTPEV